MSTRFTQRMEQICATAWCARADEWRRTRIRRSLHRWIGLAVLISTGPAFGAVAPSFLPPERNYRVKWSQSDNAQPAANWDLEITPVRNRNARFVAGAQVIPELSCWAVNVPVGVASSVRIRAFSGTRASPWSPLRNVPGPGGSYLVKWYQPPSTPPAGTWDLEVTPILNPSARFVVGAQVMPQLTCWALDVPVAEPSVVRIRSVVGTQISSWGPYTTVPEPGFAASTFGAFGLLLALARRRKGIERR